MFFKFKLHEEVLGIVFEAARVRDELVTSLVSALLPETVYESQPTLDTS